MPLLRITDSTGDTRLPWGNMKEMDAVEFQFEQFSRKGYAAFANGQMIKSFDPSADEIIMIAPIVSG